MRMRFDRADATHCEMGAGWVGSMRTQAAHTIPKDKAKCTHCALARQLVAAAGAGVLCSDIALEQTDGQR